MLKVVETMDTCILRCIIDHVGRLQATQKWADKYDMKRKIGKLLGEWTSLAEKFPEAVNNQGNSGMRETCHAALHLVEMHHSARSVQPYYPCGECYRRTRRDPNDQQLRRD